MFRKALDLQGEKKISGKDIKKLNSLLTVKFGEVATFGARANVYLRGEASCPQLVSVKTEDGEEYSFGATDAKTFDRAMTAASNGERGKVSDIEAAVVFPSLHRLWKEDPEDGAFPLNVAPVHMHPQVTQFVLNGADFMAPGLQGRQYPYAEGNIVALYVFGNPKAFAVGQWQGNRTSGIAVKVFTRFGDSLWTQNPTKPQGFTPTTVLSLADEANAGSSSGAVEPIPTSSTEEGPIRDANSGDEDETGHGGAAVAEQEAKQQAAGSDSVSREGMDTLLLQSFLQAAKTTLKQEDKKGGLKVGPLPVDVFYSQYVRPARPVNSSVDVHKSSYKKVGKFVEFLKASDFISTDKLGSVTSINRANPALREFELHEVADADDSGSKGCVGGGATASLYVEGMAGSIVEFPLHQVKPELNRLFFEADGSCVTPHCRLRAGATAQPCSKQDDGDRSTSPPDLSVWEVYIEQKQIAPAVKEFCSRHDLMVSKKLVDVKRLAIPLLCKDGGDGLGEEPATVDAVARRVLENGTARHQFHKISTVSLVGEQKVAYRQGAPQRVDIRTEKRKNHNVTIIQGLDARCYGYDVEKLRDFFKKKFSVAAFLEEQGSAMLIVVGGFLDRDVEQIIIKDLHVPSDCVENQAANRKADMKQRKK